MNSFKKKNKILSFTNAKFCVILMYIFSLLYKKVVDIQCVRLLSASRQNNFMLKDNASRQGASQRLVSLSI